MASVSSRIEVIDTVEDLRGAARARLRERILAMTPEDLAGPATELASARRSRPGAATWAVVEPNGVARAVRARNFSGRRAIREDLRDIVRRHAELRVIDVADEDGRAWWIALDSRVVLVSGRVFRPRRVPEAQRDARLALRAFARLPADPLAGAS
ncbi:hypothetical protein [Aeromicrobium alkaliterrae]|uniref:hypothetical protein n=1 Tax=Aeromicrobium alkaliterrae TaxID=302168 RepID=UPI0031CE142A